MEFNKEFYSINDVIKIDTIDSIKKSIKKFGAELTEEKIHKYYGNNPKTLKYMLECYKSIIQSKEWEFLK